MIWHRFHADAIESDAGYVILRCTDHDKPTGRYITMLGRTVYGKVPVVLSGHDSSDDAKAYCEQHFTATRKAVA